MEGTAHPRPLSLSRLEVQEFRPRSALPATVYAPAIRTVSPHQTVVVASKNLRIRAVSPSLEACDHHQPVIAVSAAES
jgi:hypothetical protein